MRPGKINIDAVARVVAAYLTVHGDSSTTHRAINDTVRRALDGTTLTAKTVNAFIAAFEMSESEATRLLCLLSGTATDVVIGELAPPVSGLGQPLARPPLYQTVQLHEFHHLGPDGRPSHHRTVQEIRALVDNVTTHHYRFDTSEVVVERVLGGTPGKPYYVAGEIWAVDLTLPRTLAAKECATLEYITRFHYKDMVEPCFRRVAHRRVENLSMRVAFHSEKLPSDIWWAAWADYRGSDEEILWREPLVLDAEHAAERRLVILERAVVGFVWEFDQS